MIFSTKRSPKSLKIYKSRPRKIRKISQLYLSMAWTNFSNARSHKIEENNLQILGFSTMIFFQENKIF